jgi:hypothetical protein
MLTPISGGDILNNLKNYYAELCSKWQLTEEETVKVILQFARAWVCMLVYDDTDDPELKAWMDSFLHRVEDAHLDIPDNLADLEE